MIDLKYSIVIGNYLTYPGVLVANTPILVIYPYCYNGYLVASAMADFHLSFFNQQEEGGHFFRKNKFVTAP